MSTSDSEFQVLGWSFEKMPDGAWGHGMPCSIMYCKDCKEKIKKIAQNHHDCMRAEFMASMKDESNIEVKEKPSIPKVGHAS
jgi:hypothetical protein